ncbi:hypothetical protein [Brevundimonas sp. FT23028]|uniref:hypothetical protein n=1 Tax=Brevundimonas sp. FT23028 TaxID=3393748 RepID=UPI003B588B9D
MIRFDSSDDEYLGWISGHSNGFVVNSRRSPTSEYLVLHRASCPSIDGRVQGVPGAYTERDYTKFASEDLDDLRSGLAPISSRFSAVCQRCAPLTKTED